MKTRLHIPLGTVAALLFIGCGGPMESASDDHDKAAAVEESLWPFINCSGSGCEGKWPDVSGCWNHNAYIVETRYMADRNNPPRPWAIDLWWSPDCRTNWGNVRATGQYEIQSQAHLTATDKGVPFAITNIEWGWQHWTAMHYAPVARVAACGQTWDNNYPGPSSGGCTGQH